MDALKEQNEKYSQSYQEMTNCGLQIFSKNVKRMERNFLQSLVILLLS